MELAAFQPPHLFLPFSLWSRHVYESASSWTTSVSLPIPYFSRISTVWCSPFFSSSLCLPPWKVKKTDDKTDSVFHKMRHKGGHQWLAQFRFRPCQTGTCTCQFLFYTSGTEVTSNQDKEAHGGSDCLLQPDLSLTEWVTLPDRVSAHAPWFSLSPSPYWAHCLSDLIGNSLTEKKTPQHAAHAAKINKCDVKRGWTA
jgi:hypothetical protein